MSDTGDDIQRYMHLSPAAIVSAIQLLETTIPDELVSRGEIMEAADESARMGAHATFSPDTSSSKALKTLKFLDQDESAKLSLSDGTGLESVLGDGPDRSRIKSAL